MSSSEPAVDDVLDTPFFLRWLTAAATSVGREAARLTDLDSAIGDADHGTNMQRGFAAVTEALEKEPPGSPGAALILAGRQLISKVGGASGTAVRDAAAARRQGARRRRADHPAAAGGRAAGRGGRGGAARRRRGGDKTMLDALLPAVEALGGGTGSFAAAGEAAEKGALATVPMLARKGRASYLGERSVGHQDPGATSSALIVGALAEAAR
ncbi:dihydroxyacetone kinase subunit DhaL [Streptomyces indonesiensis]